ALPLREYFLFTYSVSLQRWPKPSFTLIPHPKSEETTVPVTTVSSRCRSNALKEYSRNLGALGKQRSHRAPSLKVWRSIVLNLKVMSAYNLIWWNCLPILLVPTPTL
ncbi:unnamed protein product, partial [Sphacelaria rigidula]